MRDVWLRARIMLCKHARRQNVPVTINQSILLFIEKRGVSFASFALLKINKL